MKRVNDIQTIPIKSKKYPGLLKEIYDPPPLLYARGNIKLLNHPSLAVVGTRKISQYGRSTTNKLISELKGMKLVIISGLALGVDALAHQCALDNGLPTIAVLGSGIDENSIYPSCNINLARKIIQNNGLLISEIPPHSTPQKYFLA